MATNKTVNPLSREEDLAGCDRGGEAAGGRRDPNDVRSLLRHAKNTDYGSVYGLSVEGVHHSRGFQRSFTWL